MEHLYEAIGGLSLDSEGNPLSNNQLAAQPDFSNIQFPTAFNFNIDESSGIATIEPDVSYFYGFQDHLSSAEGLFCGARLGPPTVLAQACDASMSFLLGPSVSVGMLTATAKAVNGKLICFDCKAF